MKKLLIDDAKCLACHSCEIACVVTHSDSKTLYGAISEQTQHKSGIHVEPGGKGRGFPLGCRHCQDPQCVRACVTKALYAHPDGAVLFNESHCLGCQMCFIACPFGAIEENTKAETYLVSKCDLCDGSVKPSCVTACPTQALVFEDADSFSKNKRRKYLVELTSSSEQTV
jgi:carbon-monoxide dehydrogenase iron sulfur subunit